MAKKVSKPVTKKAKSARKAVSTRKRARKVATTRKEKPQAPAPEEGAQKAADSSMADKEEAPAKPSISSFGTEYENGLLKAFTVDGITYYTEEYVNKLKKTLSAYKSALELLKGAFTQMAKIAKGYEYSAKRVTRVGIIATGASLGALMAMLLYCRLAHCPKDCASVPCDVPTETCTVD